MDVGRENFIPGRATSGDRNEAFSMTGNTESLKSDSPTDSEMNAWKAVCITQFSTMSRDTRDQKQESMNHCDLVLSMDYHRRSVITAA